jgi:CHAD domain-containing protein
MAKAKRSRAITINPEPILPTDLMPEAGRKALQRAFLIMQAHEAGTRTGEDIEDVHQMRVATRRMRSLLALLGGYYTPALVKTFRRDLRLVAGVLGGVRDLDVMILDLQAYRESLDGNDRTDVEAVLFVLEAQRLAARAELVATLDSKPYRRFKKAYAAFLAEPGAGAITNTDPNQPFQVRHVAPVLIHQHLAEVRALEVLLDDEDEETFHALRIALKGLRYTITAFEEVLGKPAGAYIDAIKAMQDDLGQLNDVVVAQGVLRRFEQPAIVAYVAGKEVAAREMMAHFRAGSWATFSARGTQSKLANALLALR